MSIYLKLLAALMLAGMAALAGCQQSQPPQAFSGSTTTEPAVSSTPSESKAGVPDLTQEHNSAPQAAASDEVEVAHEHGPGMGRGRGMMGRGMMGPGRGPEMRNDMSTLHAMFDDRQKIKRTVKNLPNGAEAITESDDEKIAALLQEHVPAMEARVHEDKPLPPMTFHPIFVELIKHADDYSLTYEETSQGVKVTYQADDPFVIMLVQEHAQLVSRFIKNGMEEIHKPYTLPTLSESSAATPAP